MSSSVAAENPGWRDKVVKASAQVRRVDCAGAEDEVGVKVGFVVDGIAGCEFGGLSKEAAGRFAAATDLQKRVLVGLERH